MRHELRETKFFHVSREKKWKMSNTEGSLWLESCFEIKIEGEEIKII